MLLVLLMEGSNGFVLSPFKIPCFKFLYIYLFGIDFVNFRSETLTEANDDAQSFWNPRTLTTTSRQFSSLILVNHTPPLAA